MGFFSKLFRKNEFDISDYFMDMDLEKKKDKKYNYPILRSQAFEIINRDENLKSDFVKDDERNITFISFEKWDTKLVNIDNKKYWQVQILRGDVSWVGYEDDSVTNYDGVFIENDLKRLRAIVDVETGEYKYYPKN